MAPAPRTAGAAGEARTLPTWTPVACVVVVLAAALVARMARLKGLEYDWDEGSYWLSLESMRQGHVLFREVFSSQPPLFLGLLGPVYSALGGGIVIARLEIVALSMAGLGSAFVIARRIAGPWAGTLAALVLAFDPLYLRLSDTLQADLPSTVWGLVAMALAVEARERRARTLWLLVGLALGVGVGTKLLALALVPPLLLLALTAPGRARALLPATAGLALAGVVAMLPYLGDIPQVWRGVVGLHLGTRTAEPQSLVEKLVVLRHYHPPPVTLIAAALGLGLAARRQRLWGGLLGVWLAAALAVDLGQAPLFSHHLAVIVPPLAIAASVMPVLLAESLARRAGAPASRAGLLAGAAVAAGLLLFPAASDGPAYPDPRDQATETAIRALVRPGAPMVSDLLFATIDTGHVTPPQMVDVSFARVWTGDLGAAEAERATEAGGVQAVVFATDRLQSIPGFRAWVRSRFHKAADIKGGAELWLRGNN